MYGYFGLYMSKKHVNLKLDKGAAEFEISFSHVLGYKFITLISHTLSLFPCLLYFIVQFICALTAETYNLFF